jgi:hypothetical protein
VSANAAGIAALRTMRITPVVSDAIVFRDLISDNFRPSLPVNIL